jgi:class 3 adenylate cyclase
MGRYFEVMRAAIERHAGVVEKFIGDAVMAVFGVPMMREDDALRAVRAACDMRAARDELNVALEERHGVRLQTRCGIETGEAVLGDPSKGQAFATGDVLNTAARLEQSAGTDDPSGPRST